VSADRILRARAAFQQLGATASAHGRKVEARLAASRGAAAEGVGALLVVDLSRKHTQTISPTLLFQAAAETAVWSCSTLQVNSVASR